jgi:hypothetical protein
LAGASTLNELIQAPRVSRDVDLFHDTEQALQASWDADRQLLTESGFQVQVLRERPSFVEAKISRGRDSVLMQWSRDSAYRFFPLVEHVELGLVLHPFDLATNKVLALVGRLEVRDWVDVIECSERIQPFGYLTWAACGKDPGFSPDAILEHAGRSARYAAEEVLELSFEGEPPDPARLSRRWHSALDEARVVVPMLPPGELGKAVLSAEGPLYRGSATDLSADRARLRFHSGSVRGALPRLVDEG